MAENRELALVLKLVADQFQSELKKSQGTLGAFNTFIKDWKVQLTAVGTTLLAVAKSAANFGEEALKTSQRIGMTVEQTTALQYAAHLADVPMSTLEKGLKTLAQNAVEAANGAGQGAQLFAMLGLSATDAAGKVKPLDQLFFEFQDRLKGVTNQAQFVDAGVKTFGKSFLEMVPFIRQGSEATREAMVEGERLGAVLSTRGAQSASQFNDQIKRLEAATRGLTLQLGNELIPSFAQLLEVMTKLVSGPGGQVIKLEIQGIAAVFTMLNHGIRETAGELDVFWKKLGASQTVKKFWDDALVEGRKRLDADTSKKLHQIFADDLGKPGGAPVSRGGPAGNLDNAASMGTGPDLKKLQEDYRLYITGLTAMGEEFLKKNREGYQLYITGLTSAGQQYLDSIKGTGDDAVKLFADNQAQLAKDRDILIDNERAWISYGETLGASTDFMLQHRLDLVRLELGKELNLNQEQAGRLLIAWQNHDEELAQSVIGRSNKTAAELETIQLRTLEKSKTVINELSGDFFDGWADGLKKYATNQSMFGLAADMSRRFFQTTEQGIQKFLFDSAEGRLTRLQDISKSILNIVNQLVSQMGAQLITKSFASVFAGFAPGLFGGGGESSMTASFAASGTGFATGGRFVVPGSGGTDSVPVGFWATPGETVDVRTPSQQGGSPISVPVTIINQMPGAEIQATPTVGANGLRGLQVMVVRAVKGAISEGQLDKSLAIRYRLNPQPGR